VQSDLIRDAIGVQSDLATRRDEDEHRLRRRVIEDRAVRWLVHCGHAGAVVLAREARDVHLERHRAYLMREGARTKLGRRRAPLIREERFVTDGLKLKRPSGGMPSQSARSCALAIAVERPTMRMEAFVLVAM
jgi:hypothetical protein